MRKRVNKVVEIETTKSATARPKMVMSSIREVAVTTPANTGAIELYT